MNLIFESNHIQKKSINFLPEKITCSNNFSFGKTLYSEFLKNFALHYKLIKLHKIIECNDFEALVTIRTISGYVLAITVTLFFNKLWYFIPHQNKYSS